MRVTIAHNKGRQQAARLVDQHTEELLRSFANGPVQIVDQQKAWQGETMHFSFRGKMGFFSVPIKGFVECRDTEIVIDADVPSFVTKMIPEEKIKATVETHVRGLLA